MPYQLFQYPLPGSGDLSDLNAYLAGNRVVSVQQHLVSTPGGGLLVFVVHTTPGAPATAAAGSRKIDYKAELPPEQFALFSRLREERKKLAEAEGVPVYTVFTNEQLADMVRRQIRTLADLGRIEGIGPARLEKHGPHLLAILTAPPPTVAP